MRSGLKKENIFKAIKSLVVIAFICSLVSVSGCKNDSNDLGIVFINPNDTLGSLLLESNADTIKITEKNVRIFNNTSAISKLLVGSSPEAAGNYQAKSLLKFNGLPTDRHGETVVSANMRFKYKFYAFRDTLGTVSFNVYRVKRNLNFSTVTLDSISTADIDTKVLGTYTGNPTDISDINVTLDPNTVKDWLEYAADTNFSGKNYGIYLVPNSNSTTIKGFYDSNDGTDLAPLLSMVIDSSGRRDTVRISSSSYLSMTDAPLSIIPSNRIFVQAGVSFLSLVNFDFTKIPTNILINEAYLELTVDPVNSFFNSDIDKRVNVDRVTDSVNVTASSGGITTNPVAGDTTKYYIRINQYFQGWINGIYPKMGVLLSPTTPLSLNRIVFYDQTEPDVNKRPKLRIRYTNKF